MSLLAADSCNLDAMAARSKVKKINANMDINALTLGKMLCFCGQFVDGQASGMVLQEDGIWKVDPEQLLGQTDRQGPEPQHKVAFAYQSQVS